MTKIVNRNPYRISLQKGIREVKEENLTDLPLHIDS